MKVVVLHVSFFIFTMLIIKILFFQLLIILFLIKIKSIIQLTDYYILL